MAYTPAEPGLWGPTFSVTLNEGGNEYIGEVREPGLIFERIFMVCSVATEPSWGGLLRQENAVDTYIWKCADAPIGVVYQELVFGFTQGQGLRIFCQIGTLIFSWRERFRLGM